MIRATWMEFLNFLSRNTRLPGVSSSKAHVPRAPLNTPWLISALLSFLRTLTLWALLSQPTNLQVLVCVWTVTITNINLPQAVSKVCPSWLCWCMPPAMPALRRQKQYAQRFKIILNYLLKSVRNTQDTGSKPGNKQTNKSDS